LFSIDSWKKGGFIPNYIGKIKTFEKEVNLNADRKRFWLGVIESIDSKTMNESMTISMNYFEKDEI
jgi:hypothetical protein